MFRICLYRQTFLQLIMYKAKDLVTGYIGEIDFRIGQVVSLYIGIVGSRIERWANLVVDAACASWLIKPAQMINAVLMGSAFVIPSKIQRIQHLL